MIKRFENKARKVCAWSNYCESCEMCSSNPNNCNHWRWYLPYPFCIPEKIRWRLYILKLKEG